MNSKWKSHATKFPCASELHVPRMARLRTGESPGDSGAPPCSRVEFGGPMDHLGPLNLYQSPSHLVRYRFKPQSHGGGQWLFFRRQSFDPAIFRSLQDTGLSRISFPPSECREQSSSSPATCSSAKTTWPYTQSYTRSTRYWFETNWGARKWSYWFAENSKACSRVRQYPMRIPRNSINLETCSANFMVQKDLRPSGVLENESRANETFNQHHSHDLHVSPRIYDTLQLGTSSFTMHQPLDAPNPMGVVSNTLTRDGEDIMQGVFDLAEEIPQALPPSQQHERTDWTPYQVGAPAPISNAGVTSATRSIFPTILYDSLPSSATTSFPPTEGTSNRSDRRLICSSSQQDTTQEPSPCAEYVAPSKGPLSGGVEVTIVGTNFPHTLPLSVYFSTKLAVVVSWEHLIHGRSINANGFQTRKTRETIRCVVPAASSPGIVDVRILVEPPGSAPEIDCKMAKFMYEDERMTE